MKRISDVVDQVLCGDARDVLRTLPEACIDCVVTSPPYWSLRDYGVDGQLGLEPSFTGYINRLCDIFDEVKRVLKQHGTCWVNLGDTYANRAGSKTGDPIIGAKSAGASLPGQKDRTLPQKSLVQIPARFAIEMSRRGWILRNTIIWHKPVCKPESITDRFTVDFEYLFFFVKDRRYWFRQQFEPCRTLGAQPRTRVIRRGGALGQDYPASLNPSVRNQRAVWSISPRPFRGAHFAVFPPALVKTPIRAGCAEQVCVKCGSPVWPERRHRRRRSA